MLKQEKDNMAKKIEGLQARIQEMEALQRKGAGEKADLEYKMRSQDYNVEILKNQLEN